MVQVVYLCHETVYYVTNTFFRFCDALILCDALISNFNSDIFIYITTAASFLSRFEKVTILIFALQVIDFISTYLNNLTMIVDKYLTFHFYFFTNIIVISTYS